MIRFTRPFFFVILILTLLTSALLSACSAKTSSTIPVGDGLAIVAMDDMPAEIKTAPATVRQAYQFAVEHQDIVKRIPCYCGCGAMGHTSSYSCYISDVSSDLKITYDTHALGCSICVDITQDTMRLLKQGRSVSEIKAFVDQTYSQYGPSNLP